jgi:hypothetical protein
MTELYETRYEVRTIMVRLALAVADYISLVEDEEDRGDPGRKVETARADIEGLLTRLRDGLEEQLPLSEFQSTV